MKLLDTAFKAGQMVTRANVDLKIKTSVERAGLQTLGADVQRVSRLLKATGCDANAVAASFRASRAELATFQSMSSSAKAAYRKANDLGGTNEAAEKRIANRPYTQLEEQARTQRQARADQAKQSAEMARDRAEALAPAHAAGGFIEQKGLQTISWGLGGSVEGFLMQSAQTYMQLNSILTTVGRRFRMTAEDAKQFGGVLGYTVQQSTAMMEAMGGKTDSVKQGTFRRYAGFAREFGLDPNAAMSVLGGLQQVSGRELGESTLMSLAGRAQSRGMGQGRFEEYLQGLQGFAAEGLNATGQADISRYAGLYDIPGMVFGAQDPRGQGAMGSQFLQGLQGTMTGSGPMQSFLLRAMGFGRQGGPDYITAKKRLEAGIYDANNLQDLFGEFRARKMDKGYMFRALESVSGGQLKAWQIEKLVDTFGMSDEGFGKLKTLGSDEEKQQFVDQAMAGYSDKERAAYESGFETLGQQSGRIGMGDNNAVEVEDMQYDVGSRTAQIMISARHTIERLAETFEKFFQMNPLDAMVDVAHAVEKAAQQFKDMVPAGMGADWAKEFRKELMADPLKILFTQNYGKTVYDVITNAQGGSGP